MWIQEKPVYITQKKPSDFVKRDAFPKSSFFWDILL
jgi:hypothetical protein